MSKLHLTKVAVGCGTVEILEQRQASRRQDGFVPLSTRFRPRRADELIGGSLYWIIKHRIAVRQTIIGFDESDGGRRTIIRLDHRIVPVRAVPRRAHQGWRYLDATDAPLDLEGAGDGVAELPARLAEELALLALI